MNGFALFASPWWVNLLILVPIVLFFYYWQTKLAITKTQLLIGALFGIAFAYVEASVVIYLRAAVGLLPGYMGTLSDVLREASSTFQEVQAANALPNSLLTVEFFREFATIVMLATIAMLTIPQWKERFAFFLWVFAFWDFFYYVWLRLLIGWPGSLTSMDVLFLIPVAWLANVWFPLLVDFLSMLAVAINSRTPTNSI